MQFSFFFFRPRSALTEPMNVVLIDVILFWTNLWRGGAPLVGMIVGPA